MLSFNYHFCRVTIMNATNSRHPMTTSNNIPSQNAGLFLPMLVAKDPKNDKCSGEGKEEAV